MTLMTLEEKLKQVDDNMIKLADLIARLAGSVSKTQEQILRIVNLMEASERRRLYANKH